MVFPKNHIAETSTESYLHIRSIPCFLRLNAISWKVAENHWGTSLLLRGKHVALGISKTVQGREEQPATLEHSVVDTLVNPKYPVVLSIN